jgi:hypothetical protein
MSKHRNPLVLGVLVALVIVALQALLVPLFAGPAANLGPRDLPIAVAGPPPATAALAERLETGRAGAFDVRIVPDAAAADAAIQAREVYGAIVLSPAAAEVHIASAASPTVATLLTQAASQLGGGRAPAVRDVVPVHSGDPRGTGFASGFLPLALTALLAGALIFLLVRGRTARLVALATFATAAGLGGAAVLQTWLDVLPGDYLANAGVLALFGLAVAATMTGLGAVLDRAGLALGGITIFLIGNALGAVSAAPELLPQPWGAVGQWLPIGSGSTLLRSVAFFDGNGGAVAAGVLTAYAVIGLILVAVGRRGTGAATAEARPAGGAVPAGDAAGRQHALAR